MLRNEENFAQKSAISFTYAKVFLFGTLGFLVIMGLALVLAKSVLSFAFDPEYEKRQTQREIVALTEKIDSLAEVTDRKERFIQKFKALVEGDEDLLLYSDPVDEPLLSPDEQLQSMNEELEVPNYNDVDSAYRRRLEQEDPLLGAALASIEDSEVSSTFFLSPVTGIVSSTFQMSSAHFGVDVVTKPNEPILAVADGTVLFADWTQEGGYVIAIQHRNNIISVYKHNNDLLKKVGNFVSAGDVIAIVGNTGELTDGPHLHFELWYNGNPVDPEKFVPF